MFLVSNQFVDVYWAPLEFLFVILIHASAALKLVSGNDGRTSSIHRLHGGLTRKVHLNTYILSYQIYITYSKIAAVQRDFT